MEKKAKSLTLSQKNRRGNSKYRKNRTEVTQGAKRRKALGESKSIVELLLELLINNRLRAQH